jgi:superoxide dismutase, Cu-Zn family
MKHPMGTMLSLAMMAAAIALPAMAADVTVTMRKVTQDGTSDTLGTIIVSGTEGGTNFTMHLHGLPPGPHGFHLHENANCGPTLMNGIRIPGGAAGEILDPDFTGKHEGPTGEGHLGDLPVLDVQPDGTATQTLAAPRLKDVEALKGRALIIQVGGDNYKDTPMRDGGGGGRLACGVVQ